MKVVIAGLGLIGGSLGKALRARGWRVAFTDPAVSLEDARAANAADEKVTDLDADLIVLAAPADTALQILASLEGSPRVVTSVSSVMAPLRDAAPPITFVAGHPFAGSERTGLAAAREDLFAGRPWFIDREEPLVLEMIEATGAGPVVVDAGEHDRMMALTSHLPQVIATALAAMLDGVDPRFVGTGAQSMLRLSGSAHDVWRPILEQNETNISAAAAELWKTMERIGPEEFARAQDFYRRIIRGSGGRPER